MAGEQRAPVQPGEILAGKYQVERVLGVGGMGVVVSAMHLHLQQRVALKFMLPHALRNAEAVERFLREARAAVRLKSDHVARIIDVGTLATGSPYIVMEYLEGSDLATMVAQHGKLGVPIAVDFVLQACEAIAEAHSLGIVHRDLKPPNMFLTRQADGSPRVKVLDFGISKATSSGDFQLTRTNAVMGSPAYMSPEQMRSSKQVDGRTDIWALGVILYELVSGRVPFAGESFTELCLKIAMDPLPSLSALETSISPAFEAVVARCLAKEPEARYHDVAELAEALAPFGSPTAQLMADRIYRMLRGEPRRVSRPQPVMQAAPAPPRQQTSTLSGAAAQTVAPPPPTKRRSKLTIIGAVVTATAAAGIAIGLLQGGGSDTPPDQPAAAPAAAAPAAAETPPPPAADEPTPARTPPSGGAPDHTPAPTAAAPAEVVAAASEDATVAPSPDAGPEPSAIAKENTSTASKRRRRSRTAKKPARKPPAKQPKEQSPGAKPAEEPAYDPLASPY